MGYCFMCFLQINYKIPQAMLSTFSYQSPNQSLESTSHSVCFEVYAACWSRILVFRDVELRVTGSGHFKVICCLHLEGFNVHEEFPFFEVLGPLKMEVTCFFGFCDQLTKWCGIMSTDDHNPQLCLLPVNAVRAWGGVVVKALRC